MRIFEALTIVFAGQIVLAAAVMSRGRPRWTGLLPLLILAPLAAHLVLEGYRWQMAPAYLVTLVACVGGCVRYAMPAARLPHRAFTTAAGVAGFLLLMLAAAACVAFPAR